MDDERPTWTRLLHAPPFGEQGVLHVPLVDRRGDRDGGQGGTPPSREKPLGTVQG